MFFRDDSLTASQTPPIGECTQNGLVWEENGALAQQPDAISTQRSDTQVHVRFTNPDMLVPPNLRDASKQLLDTVTAADNCEVVIDLSNIDFFLASEAVGMLIAAHTTLKRQGGALRISGATGHVREVFHVTRLDELIPVDES